LNGKNILLLDDVATTGSTVEEAARVLKTAGARKSLGISHCQRIKTQIIRFLN
jgi:predicted amidophosphoribosyltransferase